MKFFVELFAWLNILFNVGLPQFFFGAALSDFPVGLFSQFLFERRWGKCFVELVFCLSVGAWTMALSSRG